MLAWALELARRECLDEITLVNTFLVPTGYLEAGMTYEGARDSTLKVHRADVDQLLAAQRESSIRIKTIIEEGPIPETVARIATEQKADLLVVGSESRSFLAALLLGRMGVRIASRTCVPVALIKSQAHQLGLLAALKRL
jgi:nucleotide-binding universal stress UspA family protein